MAEKITRTYPTLEDLQDPVKDFLVVSKKSGTIALLRRTRRGRIFEILRLMFTVDEDAIDIYDLSEFTGSMAFLRNGKFSEFRYQEPPWENSDSYKGEF